MISGQLLSFPSTGGQPASTTGSANGNSVAPENFLLMLGQLLGTAVPKSASTGAPIAVVGEGGGEGQGDESEAEGAPLQDLAALFALTLPVTPPDPRGVAQGSATPALSALAGAALPGRSSSESILESSLTSELLRLDQSAPEDAAPRAESLRLPTAVSEMQAARAPTTSEAYGRPVPAPVGTPQWTEEVGSRLLLMAGEGRHTASLRMSPEHLGPLEIRIAVQGDQASVWFGAAHADTRAAIEHALPRLRELFESQGLSLADTGVFREPPRQQPASNGLRSASEGLVGNEAEVTTAVGARLGLVDAYA